MARGKTNYTFTVNANPQAINNLMHNFLKANGYTIANQDGITYFQYFDVIWGNRFLEYYIQGNQITILAYIGTFKKPTLLDDSFVGMAAKQDYKNKLLPLFEELKKLNNNEGFYEQQTPEQITYENVNTAETTNGQVNQFADSVNKRNEGMAIAGFVISIVGLLLSCFGITFGVLILALEIYFAIMGLKTSKKGFSIATFVLSGLSFLVLIAQIVFVVLFG